MDRRACIWVRIGWLTLGFCLTLAVGRYVSQLRYQVVGNCAPSVVGVPAMLIFDSLTAGAFCVPLPMPDKAEVAPKVPSDDNKTGV